MVYGADMRQNRGLYQGDSCLPISQVNRLGALYAKPLIEADAKALAGILFEHFGLRDWRIAFTLPQGDSRGTCSKWKRLIVLRPIGMQYATLLHEIAHAITPYNVPSHGKVFTANFVRILDIANGL